MIIFTDHALRRMRERKITKAQVVETVKNPEIEMAEDDDIKLLRKHFGNQSLEVAVEMKGGKNKIIVITLYWL